jgi:hypothetical protein
MSSDWIFTLFFACCISISSAKPRLEVTSDEPVILGNE